MLFGAAADAETTGQQRAEVAGRGLVGSPAPQLLLKTIDGETIDLGRLYGKKAVYLKYWATWCGPCREHMSHFERVHKNAGPDLAVIAINAGFSDSLEDIPAYRRELAITMPIVFDDDGHLGAAFNLRVTPQHVVIGREGRIQYVGHLADKRLDAALLATRVPGIARVSNSVDKRAQIDARNIGVGDQLPAMSVQTLDGRSFQLQEISARRPTVFVFISPWCEEYLATTRPAVAASCRSVRKQVGAFASERRVRWLGIASGLWATPDDVREYRTAYKVKIPLTLDESDALFRAFRVSDVPTVIVADAQGKMVNRVESSDPQGLRKALDELRLARTIEGRHTVRTEVTLGSFSE